MGEANIPATAFPIRAMRGSRPGLPRESQWRAEQRRQQRVQLFVVGERQQWGVLEFQRDEPQSQQREQPRLRSSVALPLSVYRRSSAEQGGPDVRFFLFRSSGVSERCRAGSSGVSDGYGGSIVRTINSVTY